MLVGDRGRAVEGEMASLCGTGSEAGRGRRVDSQRDGQANMRCRLKGVDMKMAKSGTLSVSIPIPLPPPSSLPTPAAPHHTCFPVSVQPMSPKNKEEASAPPTDSMSSKTSGKKEAKGDGEEKKNARNGLP